MPPLKADSPSQHQYSHASYASTGSSAAHSPRSPSPPSAPLPHEYCYVPSPASSASSAAASAQSPPLADEEPVEVLAQVVAAFLDLAQEPVEADLVLEARDARNVAVVGFVLLDGEVGGVEEGGELEGRGEVGGGVGGGCLRDDEDGEGEGREDEGEGGKGEVAGSHGCVQTAVEVRCYVGAILTALSWLDGGPVLAG
ncbi:hypothetical protein V500_02498 [Pseudogymnoascus sp. VKM F-4518 (FW-2643)]|nr:hypothetical protein V500_02498 [Pseudogymnoascus sp. VKM F-4518 (FW-2643)]